MNTYPAKVNRTVRYKTTAGRWRSGVITAVIDVDTCDLRVGHHGETYAGKDRRTDPTNPASNDKWRPG